MRCGICGGPLTPLGLLGRVLHVKCRDCGLEVQKEVPDCFVLEIDDETVSLEELDV